MNYETLISSIVTTHEQTRKRAVGAVDRQLLFRNWIIGAYLITFEQEGSNRAQYGTGLLKRVADDLESKQINGTGVRMLERMRIFYLTYPQMAEQISSPPVTISETHAKSGEVAISSPVVTKSASNSQPSPLTSEKLLLLSWSQIIELLAIEDPWKRAFYEGECIAGNWSKRQLQRQIGSLLYESTGFSTDKEAVMGHARDQGNDSPKQISEMIRDPCLLEFTGLIDRTNYRESDLEKALLDHLQAFLLELGTGFCFEARQKRITVGNEHDYIGLVFYNRKLRCHLLIDLKVRAFQHGDAGQMNFYLNFWKDKMMEVGDTHPVGLLLCTDKEETKVEYATAGLDQRLFVSRYLVALPKPEEIRSLIEGDRAVFEEQAAYNRQTPPVSQ